MMFSTLSTRTHGVIDYSFGLLMGVLPRAIGASPKVTALMQGSAVGAAAYSLLTDYELGAVKAIPMKGHLALDAVSGAGFLGAAALFDDEEPGTRALLAGIGVFELTASLLTSTTPSGEGVLPRKSFQTPDASPTGYGSTAMRDQHGRLVPHETAGSESTVLHEDKTPTLMRNEHGELVPHLSST